MRLPAGQSELGGINVHRAFTAKSLPCAGTLLDAALAFLAKRPPQPPPWKWAALGAPCEFWACAQPTTTPLRPLHLIRRLQDCGMAAATCMCDGNRQFPQQQTSCDLQGEAA